MLCCLIGLIVAGIGIGVVSYLRFREAPKALFSALPKDMDLSLNHIHHVATRDGVKEWVLDADSAQYQKADNKTVFKNVSATFFLKDGKTIHLTGQDGVLLTDTKDIEVAGHVIVRSGPYKLNTDRLHYEHKTQTIFTDTPIAVTVKGNHMALTGDSLTFNLQTGQTVVRGKVRAVFKNFSL